MKELFPCLRLGSSVLCRRLKYYFETHAPQGVLGGPTCTTTYLSVYDDPFNNYDGTKKIWSLDKTLFVVMYFSENFYSHRLFDVGRRYSPKTPRILVCRGLSSTCKVTVRPVFSRGLIRSRKIIGVTVSYRLCTDKLTLILS